MWSALYLLNTGAGRGARLDGPRRMEQRDIGAGGRNRCSLALQIMNMSGWLLERASNIFRQLESCVTRWRRSRSPSPCAMHRLPQISLSRPARSSSITLPSTTGGGREGTVIENFNLRIAPARKSVFSLVGPEQASRHWSICCSGCSTSKAVPSRIDGQDIREVTQESVRAAIGLVSQDTSLLPSFGAREHQVRAP